MSDDTIFGGAAELRGKYERLAEWLQGVMQRPDHESERQEAKEQTDSQLELQLTPNYHVTFYQQLPDFIMALLEKDVQATRRYAPLLYHLIGCSECHAAYLDLYDAMRAAVEPREPRPLLGQGTRTLAATPHRMLSHLSRTLISQAEALLQQGRREHKDNNEAARALLQLALKVSAHITQSTVRRQALRDLVRVATLFDGASAPMDEERKKHAYSPVMAGAGGVRRAKVVRRAESGLKANNAEAVITLQAKSLEGSVRQQGETLELYLHDLGEELRGAYVEISVLLGSLLEPVQWAGGNPRSIRSAVPVDQQGTLITPIGSTSLSLSNAEERNLLEGLFLLLEVKKAD